MSAYDMPETRMLSFTRIIWAAWPQAKLQLSIKKKSLSVGSHNSCEMDLIEQIGLPKDKLHRSRFDPTKLSFSMHNNQRYLIPIIII